MRLDYPIKTDRLVLRPFEPGDLDDLHAYRANPEVCRYLYGEPATIEESEQRLEKSLTAGELTEEGQWLVLAVCLDGKVIGDVVLKWVSESDQQGELGYVFNPEFTGKGYAREASEEMLRIGFEELKLHRIIAQCDPRNEPSWRLMERLGMRREAHFRHNEIFKGKWGDLFVYAMLEEEYRNAQA
ncbi:MAG TPA: GNAT family N-acetyltransferase [Lentzea sp.]